MRAAQAIFAVASLCCGSLAAGTAHGERGHAPLVLEMLRGSNVHYARSATVAVRLRNTTDHDVALYVRRDLMTYEVVGPDGNDTICEPMDPLRHPGRRGFTTLGPHRSVVLTSRLVELCPRWTFARRGEYRVRAAYRPEVNGSSLDIHGFTGSLEAGTSALVHVERNAHVVANHVVPQRSSVQPAVPTPTPTPTRAPAATSSPPPQRRPAPVRR